jgi:hypothetical protein
MKGTWERRGGGVRGGGGGVWAHGGIRGGMADSGLAEGRPWTL